MRTPLAAFFNILLDVFIQINSEEDAQQSQQVHFEDKSEREFEHHEVNGEWRIESGV